MVAAAEKFYGHLDILVNNAGCNVRKPALDVTWDDWNLILDTNLRGSFFVAQEVARRMIRRAATGGSSISDRSRVWPDMRAWGLTARAGEGSSN